jgi:hypothetical protein
MKAKQLVTGSLMLLMTALTMTSCIHEMRVVNSSSPAVSEIRQHKGFDQIEIWGSPNVYYTQADSFSVRIEGPKDVVDNIVTKVSDQTLSIRNKGKLGFVNIVMFGDDQLNVYVSSPDLIRVELNGSGTFVSKRRVDTDNLEISLRGSGDINFNDIICDHCTTNLTGSGDIVVNRLESQTSDVSLVGSGDMTISQWRVHETDVELRGSGDVKVDFVEGCQKVTSHLVGSGDIILTGKVNQFHMTKNGSGDMDTDHLSVNDSR